MLAVLLALPVAAYLAGALVGPAPRADRAPVDATSPGAGDPAARGPASAVPAG